MNRKGLKVLYPIVQFIEDKNGGKMVSIDENERILLNPSPNLSFTVYKNGKKTSVIKGIKNCYISGKGGVLYYISENTLEKIADACGYLQYPTDKELFDKWLEISKDSIIYAPLNRALAPFWLKLWGYDINSMTLDEIDEKYNIIQSETSLMEKWLKRAYTRDRNNEKKKILKKSEYLRKLLSYICTHGGISRAKAEYYLRCINLELFVNKYRVLDGTLFTETDMHKYKYLYKRYDVYTLNRRRKEVKTPSKRYGRGAPFYYVDDGEHYIVEVNKHISNGFNGYLGIIMREPVDIDELWQYCLFAESSAHIDNDKYYKTDYSGEKQ